MTSFLAVMILLADCLMVLYHLLFEFFFIFFFLLKIVVFGKLSKVLEQSLFYLLFCLDDLLFQVFFEYSSFASLLVEDAPNDDVP